MGFSHTKKSQVDVANLKSASAVTRREGAADREEAHNELAKILPSILQKSLCRP
jgi:hypothetical protein